MNRNSAKNLLDFLNHGVLPFVGRTHEAERLHQFWESTTSAQGLRAALLEGEAGIGKSRLIEEVIPKILAEGGGVIHAKLYPESATNIVSLLSRSLWQSTVGRDLLKKEPEGTRESLVASLRRIAGLRPALIIIEDIHLLSSDAIRELSSLLDSLADDTISVLALTRLLGGPSRSIFERYITEEIVLEGLDRKAFLDVCAQLFTSGIDEEVIRALEKTTFGNALALRSALRGALKTGFLDRKDERSPWKMTIPPQAFERHLENNVRTLSEGMAAHLDEEERVAAESLSILGELFSVEAAEVLLKNSSRMLDELRFKGMIVTSATAQAPLSGKQSTYPLLAFTHSLLHKYFFERTHVWGDEIARLLTADVPLYGIAPFIIMAQNDVTEKTEVSSLDVILRKMLELAHDLDTGLDWELASVVWEAMQKFFEKNRSRWSVVKARELEAEITRMRITLIRRRFPDEEFRRLLAKLLELTSDPQTPEEATRRMNAHVCEYWYLRRQPGSDQSVPDLKERVSALVEKFPDVIVTMEYHVFLNYIAQFASEINSQELVDEIQEQVKKSLSHPKSTPKLEHFVYGYIYPHFLAFFRTKEELKQKLEQAAKIGKMDDYLRGAYLACYRDLLMSTGRIKDALEQIKEGIHFYQSHGFKYSLFTSEIHRLSAEISLFGSTEGKIAASVEAYRYLPQDEHTLRGGADIVLHRFLLAGLAIGDLPFLREVAARFVHTGAPKIEEYFALYQLWNGEDPREYINEYAGKPNALLDAAKTGAEADGKLPEVSKAVFTCEIIRLNDLLDIYFAIELLRFFGAEPGFASDISSQLKKAFEFIVSCELPAFAAAMTERYSDYLDPKDIKKWNAKLAKLSKREASQEADEYIRLSMLGVIEFKHPDGEIERVRGARLRSVLGMMTANIMLSDPLSRNEFCFVAAGEKDDPDLARKTVNMAISSLRDDLGDDAIITTGETPALNLERVKVDLIEASDMLDDAARSVRRGSIMRAYPDVMKAMEMALGKVPFPTLYDNLFEALREDFDSRMRKVTLDLGRRLDTEGDHKSAVILLRKYVAAIPDDEEVSELLAQSLDSSGQKAEAERIRMKMKEAAE